MGGLVALLYALSGAILFTGVIPKGDLITAVTEGTTVEAGKRGSTRAAAVKTKIHPAVNLLKTTTSTGQILVPNTPPTASSLTGATSSSASSSRLDEATFAHLSTLFAEVVQPIVHDVISPLAVDAVKIYGWSILDQIFRPTAQLSSQPSSTPSATTANDWNVERLLCESFLKGEVSSADIPPVSANPVSTQEREKAMAELARTSSANVVRIEEVPSWPQEWIAARISSGVVKMFETALLGMSGLLAVDSVEWEEVRGVKVIAVSFFL